MPTIERVIWFVLWEILLVGHDNDILSVLFFSTSFTSNIQAVHIQGILRLDTFDI